MDVGNDGIRSPNCKRDDATTAAQTAASSTRTASTTSFGTSSDVDGGEDIRGNGDRADPPRPPKRRRFLLSLALRALSTVRPLASPMMGVLQQYIIGWTMHCAVQRRLLKLESRWSQVLVWYLLTRAVGALWIALWGRIANLSTVSKILAVCLPPPELAPWLSEFFLEVEIPRLEETFVNTRDAVVIHVNSSDTIGIVKAKIRLFSFEDPKENLYLCHGADALEEDDRTISDYGIRTRGISPSDRPKIQVLRPPILRVRLCTSRVIWLEIDEFDTVATVKWKLRRSEGIPTEHQILDFDGTTLQNETGYIMDDHGIRHLSMVEMLPVFVFCVRTLAGKTIQLCLKTVASVDEVKERIEKETSISVEQQCLFFNGQQIFESDATIAELGIENGTVIYVTKKEYAITDKVEVSGRSIPQPEYRAITLNQLKDVAIQILLRCEKERWTSTDPRHENKMLKPEDVTLYDLVHHFIKPSTSARKCSYIELVADALQSPRWFVSHSWGESVLSFVTCIEQHAFDRALGGETPYWVCAYAINQWSIADEVGSHPKMSPFYKAMRLTEGALSVLDHNASSYGRIWCSFEVSLALRDFNDYLYDVYTIAKNEGGSFKGVGLTDGPVAADKYWWNEDGSLNMNSPRENKEYIHKDHQRMRQSCFPLKTCRKALEVALETAIASKEEDKRMILNCIVGQTDSLHSQPPKRHTAYEETNALLRGKFAVSAYRNALEGGEIMEKYRTALCNHPHLRHLNLSFRKIPEFRDEACHFAMALPTSLEALELDYDGIAFESSVEFAVGMGRLSNLKSFTLCCGDCENLSNLDCLWEALGQFSKLRQLDLRFGGSANITSIDGLGESISNLVDLRKVDLHFNWCKKIKSVDRLANGLASLRSLLCMGLNLPVRPLSGENSIIELCRTKASQDDLMDYYHDPCRHIHCLYRIDDMNTITILG